MVALIRTNVAIVAALIGVIELLGALGCLICTLMFGNVTNTAINKGKLYSKYYESATATQRHSTNGGTYWWIGLPFLLPGMIGIYAFASRKVAAMIAFMIANVISFFVGIALAIFVGLFYNLWKVPMNAYNNGNCVFEYNEQQFKTFCQCKITTTADVRLMDADRMWIFVQGCDEVETINVMLITIISLAIVTSIIALICSCIACYGLRYREIPKNAPRKGFNPPPAEFLLAQKEEQKPAQRQEQRQEPAQAPLQPRNDYQKQKENVPRQQQPRSYEEEKPMPYKSQYASQYPPPYQDATRPEKQPESDDEGDIDDGWL